MDEEIRQIIINIQNQIESLERKITEGVFSNTVITTKEQIVQRGGIQSNNYVAGTSGWRLDADGNINGNTPLAGTKVYYVSDTSGGAVNRKLTFKNGILISET
jgi:hypothetical protein